jgi:hypothetical protein
MAHRPVRLNDTYPRIHPAAHTTPLTPPNVSRLEATRQRLFAQRLAVLIARIRAAHSKRPKEVENEHE